MNIVKYEHACFTVEKGGQLIIIDPGTFTTDFVTPENVVAVVVTHEHADHLDLEQLAAIADKNSEVMIFGPKSVTARLESLPNHTVMTGDIIEAGPFSLEFHGNHHAVIHEGIPPIPNLGVLINELIYYPGDALTLTQKPVDTLALPIAAPWLKISEAIDFMNLIRPRLAFPTHDKILSAEGKAVFDHLLDAKAQEQGIIYKRIDALEV